MRFFETGCKSKSTIVSFQPRISIDINIYVKHYEIFAYESCKPYSTSSNKSLFMLN